MLDIFSTSKSFFLKETISDVNRSYILVTEITCPEPFEPKNGLIERSVVVYRGKTVFSCNEGYLMQGDATLTCTLNGTWDHDQPTCTGMLLVLL